MTRRSSRHRTRLLLITAAGLWLGSPIAGLAEEHAVARSDWRDPDAWRQLRLGMSPGQVVALLGEPGKVTRYYAFERWEYPDALGKRLNFDEKGRLMAWGAHAR